MTVKEIEERSGLTRANIRFYENEGLITPKRNENGYRDYSEDELDELLRIKLLRSLDFSIEEIRNLKEGKRSLADAAKFKLSQISKEQERLKSAAGVCSSMVNDGASYSSMNTHKYLQELKDGPETPRPILRDIPPRVTSPWKRYFARMFDIAVYEFIFDLVLVYLFYISPIRLAESAFATISGFAALVMMLFIEPTLLSTWGTTPGKWIFGLSVRDKEGFKLTWNEAFVRTQRVLWYGMGLSVPIYTLVRMWKSYRSCYEDTLEWEISTALELKDEKKWRRFAYVKAWILLILVSVFAMIMSSVPVNRGDLTKEELIENYNRYSNYYGLNIGLNSDGHWEGQPEPGAVVVEFGPKKPDFIFHEENGIVTEVKLQVYGFGDSIYRTNYQNITSCMVYALTRSGEGYFPLTDKTEKLTKFMSENPFEDFEFEFYGYKVRGDYNYSGYFMAVDSILWPNEDEAQKFSYELTIKKIN